MTTHSPQPVDAVVYGTNADLIASVASLYAPPNAQIADLTYGKGVFWRKTPHLTVTGSDLVTVPERPYDFRSTPYSPSTFDITVLDPPYIHNPGKHPTDSRYQNAATTAGMGHTDIRKLYTDGMTEAARITKDGGQVWVKCKDEVESGIQRWSHIEICLDATHLNLYPRDLFILIPPQRTSTARWTTQKHARKPHSYLWVFDKTPKAPLKHTKAALLHYAGWQLPQT